MSTERRRMELRDLCVAKRDEGYTLEEYERAVNGNWDITAYARNQKMFCLRDGLGFPEGYENCIESYHLQGRKVTIIGNELLSGMKVMWMMIGWDPRDLICWYWKDNDMIPFTLSGKNIRITEEQEIPGGEGEGETHKNIIALEIDLGWKLIQKEEVLNAGYVRAMQQLNSFIGFENQDIFDEGLIQKKQELGWNVDVHFVRKNPEREMTERDIEKILSDGAVTFGEYSGVHSKVLDSGAESFAAIYIYADILEAFVNYAKTKENVFIDRISMVNYVLAHEFFHAYQDFCVCFEKMDRELGRFQGDDRIESFAEYFALRFLKDVLKDETLFQYMKESRDASRKRSAELGKKDPYGDAVSLFGDIEKDTTECFLSEYDKWVSDIRGSYRK